ncbi:hypothetical protein YC2023_064915 [Brassica napus]
MFASRIVEFLEDLVEEIDVRCLSDVRGDLPLPDTDQRDRMVLVGDRWWYFSLSLAFRFGLMYEGPLGKLFSLVAHWLVGDFAVDLC